MSTKAPNGYVIFEGASRLDGAPIVVIATGMAGASRNAKTGDMIQTWILRADMPPAEALRTGADSSICGGCPLRGDGAGKARACYVTVWQAPRSVHDAYVRGAYPRAALADLPALFAGRKVRLGAYGDPAAAPLALWQAVTSQAESWTGYTHQWRTFSGQWRALLMASADSMHDAVVAQLGGWRTFRVATDSDRLDAEIVCPASAEAGKRTDCAHCGLCKGTASGSRKSIVIRAHGSGAKHLA